jgi:Asp-tRNA(Asn)/Glu-tRNA(Gln) amidotransferase A subunit family amidase
MTSTPSLTVLLPLLSTVAYMPSAHAVDSSVDVEVEEITVQSVQEDLRSRRYTARQLAEASLARIATYNPGYNAIITPNPDALREADSIDRRRAAGELLGPLAGIPVVVKDTIDMAGLPTTAGWAPLSGRAGGIDLLPERDAPVVARLRAAGAVILGKTNVPVFSGSADNANDSWAGPTYNAAAPTRAPGGSSTGTATAVAASFAVLGLAEETGGSIQCPAANQALVGIKPTFGLVPNSGVVPLAGSTRDVIGPIARSVRDAAIALDALAGYTPADPKTVAAIGKLPAGGYDAALEGATLNGKRIGTYGPGWLATPLSIDTRKLYDEVLLELQRQGAVLVDDPFAGSDFASIARPIGKWRYDGRGQESVVYDLQQYLAGLGGNAAVGSVAELKERTGKDLFSKDGVLDYMHDYPAFVASLTAPDVPPDLGEFLSAREHYLATFSAVMDRHRLDALVFPQPIGEPLPLLSKEFNEQTTVSQINIGGFPAVTVPAGYYASGTPFGIIVIGRLWDEASLLRLAHAYEQQTHRRRPPMLVLDPAKANGNTP